MVLKKYQNPKGGLNEAGRKHFERKDGGNLKKGTTKPTSKGVARGKMTPGERAKDRASKASGNPKSAYKYNSKTNRATKK